MAKHAVVISLAALGSADLAARLQFLPNIASLIAGGTWVKEVKGVYPSITSSTIRQSSQGLIQRPMAWLMRR